MKKVTTTSRSVDFLNAVVFVALVFQTTATVLMTRYSRTRDPNDDPKIPIYATTSAVALAEFFKMWVGIIVVLYDIIFRVRARNPLRTFNNMLFGDMKTFFKMGVPATTYAIQNNLLILALHHLDSHIYQVIYQIKTFTTALFSKIMLGKSYTNLQWASFALLAAGASFAEWSSIHSTTSHNNENTDRNSWFGGILVITATMTSGYAGVFMEKEFKTSETSLWVKNIQLGLFGFISTMINSYFMGDWTNIISKYGFLHGFNYSTWIVIASNTLGGYLVAILLKYASNIAKAFSAGLAIILIVLFSSVIFKNELNLWFFMGLILTLFANYLYNSETIKQQNQKTQQQQQQLINVITTTPSSPSATTAPKNQ